MIEELRRVGKDQLNTFMIIGLNGWGDAGKVSTFTVEYLVKKLHGKKICEIPIARFHNHLLGRPTVSIQQGVIQKYVHPKNEVFQSKYEEVKAVLLLGTEPHLNWSEYTETILRLSEETDVKRIYTIGGFLTDVQHGGEITITASTNNNELISELQKINLELTNYEGPTSVYSEIQWRGKDKGLDVVSLWCGVPLYVSGLYPKAVYQLLTTITLLTGIKIDLSDLEKRAQSFDAQLKREAMNQPQLRRIIENIEKRNIAEKEPTYIH